MLYKLLFNVFLLVCTVLAEPPPIGSVPLKIINRSGHPVELFWVNTFIPEPELVMQTTKPIRNSSETNINSYDTHEFVIKFYDKKLGKEANFTKGPKEEIIYVTYDEDEQALKLKQTTKFDEIMDNISQGTKLCSRLSEDEFTQCVADVIYEDITKITDAKEKAEKYRDLLSSRLRNYTCEDDSMNTSTPISSYNIRLHDKSVKVEVLQDLPSAKIWYVDNFISEDECNVLVNHGRPLLVRATVAGEAGESVVSESRKAQQAGYSSHHRHKEKDPLWPLFTRILQLTNAHTDYDLQPDGQEDFTIIQYNPSDQYTPHCDGDCAGVEHNKGGRVATAVLYCKVAERGGATTFTKSDLFVKPKVGMATFFSYKGPDGKMDVGYTEHSGCPVIEGEKWITTLWMRDGVSAQEPWTLFDPSGIRMLSPDGHYEVDESTNYVNDEL